jgi:hypothetical protein
MMILSNKVMYSQVQHLEGGRVAWKKAGLPIVGR